jgi:hypothetical protein
MRRGIVSGRVALLPRSAEIQPLVAPIRPSPTWSPASEGSLQKKLGRIFEPFSPACVDATEVQRPSGLPVRAWHSASSEVANGRGPRGPSGGYRPLRLLAAQGTDPFDCVGVLWVGRSALHKMPEQWPRGAKCCGPTALDGYSVGMIYVGDGADKEFPRWGPRTVQRAGRSRAGTGENDGPGATFRGTGGDSEHFRDICAPVP